MPLTSVKTFTHVFALYTLETDDYIPSKYHLSDRSTPPGGDDFVTYDGL
jgi:hypothetical protein